MSKMRSDSGWNRLTPEQKDRLEGWLFKENISYKLALVRCEQEFGFVASMRGLSEYYQRLAGERAERQVMELKARCPQFDEATPDWKLLGNAARRMMAERKARRTVESL
jgi:hypothetical protein